MGGNMRARLVLTGGILYGFGSPQAIDARAELQGCPSPEVVASALTHERRLTDGSTEVYADAGRRRGGAAPRVPLVDRRCETGRR